MMCERYSDPLFVQNYIQGCNVVYLDYYRRSKAKSGWKKIVSPKYTGCKKLLLMGSNCSTNTEIKEEKSNSKLSIYDTMCKDTDVLMKHLCCFE